MQKALYVGLDVHKATISVTAAEEGRDGDIRFIGPIPNTPTDIAKMAKRLSRKGHRLEFCYEAGCCGYVIFRQLKDLGHACTVVAPSKIPRRPGDRIKTDRRDSQKLAIMHRAGDLTPVWVPDEVHESIRDLVRVRLDALNQLRQSRSQLLAFLLRHGRSYTGGATTWTYKHRQWLTGQKFEQPAHQVVFQDYLEAVWAGEERRDELGKQLIEVTPLWSLNSFVEALRGLRGIEFLSAVTILAAIGDISRFETPRHLMAYLGLVPSEHSSGDSIRRGGITKTGNNEARRVLIEAAWCYRFPARIAQRKADVVVKLPKTIREISWKAQVRLCERYRRLLRKGKKSQVVTTAIARELSGFIWAIGQEVRPGMS